MDIQVKRIETGVSGFRSLPVFRVQLRHCRWPKSVKAIEVYTTDSDNAMEKALRVAGLSYTAVRADEITLPSYEGLLAL